MKNMNVLVTIILLILYFCTNVNAGDTMPSNPDECGSALTTPTDLIDKLYRPIFGKIAPEMMIRDNITTREVAKLYGFSTRQVELLLNKYKLDTTPSIPERLRIREFISLDDFVTLVLKDREHGIQRAQRALKEELFPKNTPILEVMDAHISAVLKDIIREEKEEEQTSLINLSYWVLGNDFYSYWPIESNMLSDRRERRSNVIEVERILDETRQKLHITGLPESLHITSDNLLNWLNSREIQLEIMYYVVQRAEEGTALYDWVRSYKTEIDKLQFPSQHVLSLLREGNNISRIIEELSKRLREEENTIVQEAAEELNIPYSVLYFLVSTYKENFKIYYIMQPRAKLWREEIKRRAIKMREDGKTIESISTYLWVSEDTIRLLLNENNLDITSSLF